MPHETGNSGTRPVAGARALAGLLGTVLLCAAASSPAGVYKWVDEKGKVHYGDRPPASAKDPATVQVETRPTAAAPAPDARERREKQRRLLEKYERERAAKKADAAKEKAHREEVARYCVGARHELAQMKDANYVYELDEQGKRVIFSAEKRAAETAALEADIAKHCR